MSKPKFCGFCGEDLSKYDPRAGFCMNCGQPILIQDTGPGGVRPAAAAPGTSYGGPVDQMRTTYQPSYPPPSPYYRPPRQKIDYVPVSESLDIFLTKPREIGNVFLKTSWRTILLIVFGFFFLQIIAIEILLTKVTLNLTPEFIASLAGGYATPDLGITPEAFANMFVSMLPYVLPISFLTVNFIMLLILGVIVYILMHVTGIDREIKSFRIAMTAVAFAFLPLLALGAIQIVFAILYPSGSIDMTSEADIGFLASPAAAFNNLFLLIGIESIFGIASAVYLFWGLSRGMKLENNKAMVITIGYAIAFFYWFTSVINAILYLLFPV